MENPSGADSGMDVELKAKTSLTDPPEDDLLQTEDPNEPKFKDMQPMKSLDLLEPSSLNDSSIPLIEPSKVNEFSEANDVGEADESSEVGEANESSESETNETGELVIESLTPRASFLVDEWKPIEYKLIRRVAVFPIQSDKDFGGILQEAWWEIRSELTRNKRFLVASRKLLEREGLLQGRRNLSSSEVMAMGKQLKSQVLITIWFQAYHLSMVAYEVEGGQVLWSQQLRLDEAAHIQGQLKEASKKLIRAFIAAIPYQGFVVKDKVLGEIFNLNSDKTFNMSVDIGLNSQVDLGDLAQLIRLRSHRCERRFNGNFDVEVLAAGIVIEKGDSRFRVRFSDFYINPVQIKEGALIRFPKEFERFQRLYTLPLNKSGAKGETGKRSLGPTYVDESSLKKEEKKSSSSTVHIISMVNLILFLLIAL